MKKVRMATILALFTLVIATSAAGTPGEDVRCREIAFSLSAEQRDAASFAAFIDADARFVGNSVSRGVEQVVAAWQAFFTDDGPAIKWRPQFVEVLEDGKLALSRGPYKLTSVDEDGNTVERWGTFNSVWRLHDDGEWRIVFDAGSPSSEPPSDEQLSILESTCDAESKQ